MVFLCTFSMPNICNMKFLLLHIFILHRYNYIFYYMVFVVIHDNKVTNDIKIYFILNFILNMNHRS